MDFNKRRKVIKLLEKIAQIFFILHKQLYRLKW